MTTRKRAILTPASQVITRAWSTTHKDLLEAVKRVLPEAWQILPDGQWTADAIAAEADQITNAGHSFQMSWEDYVQGLKRIDDLAPPATESAQSTEHHSVDYVGTRDAVAIKAWPNSTYPGMYVIEVECPHCPKTHTHGWAGPGDDGGHRAAHCASQYESKGGYNITIPDGFKATR